MPLPFSNIGRLAPGVGTNLSDIARILEEEGNRDTIEMFEMLVEELARSEPRSASVRALWRALVEASPGVKEAIPRFDDLNQILA